jgi:hypothetical protein
VHDRVVYVKNEIMGLSVDFIRKKAFFKGSLKPFLKVILKDILDETTVTLTFTLDQSSAGDCL